MFIGKQKINFQRDGRKNKDAAWRRKISQSLKGKKRGSRKNNRRYEPSAADTVEQAGKYAAGLYLGSRIYNASEGAGQKAADKVSKYIPEGKKGSKRQKITKKLKSAGKVGAGLVAADLAIRGTKAGLNEAIRRARRKEKEE